MTWARGYTAIFGYMYLSSRLQKPEPYITEFDANAKMKANPTQYRQLHVGSQLFIDPAREHQD